MNLASNHKWSVIVAKEIKCWSFKWMTRRRANLVPKIYPQIWASSSKTGIISIRLRVVSIRLWYQTRTTPTGKVNCMGICRLKMRRGWLSSMINRDCRLWTNGSLTTNESLNIQATNHLTTLKLYKLLSLNQIYHLSTSIINYISIYLLRLLCFFLYFSLFLSLISLIFVYKKVPVSTLFHIWYNIQLSRKTLPL